MTIFSRAFISALALAVATTAVAGAAADPFAIPVVLPLTGPVAFIGQNMQGTLRQVEALVNGEGGIRGRPLHFDVHDDASSPQVAVQVTQGILQSKPSAIMGSAIAAMCLAMEPLTRNGPVQFCISPSPHPPQGAYLFSGSFSTHEQARAIVRYFKSRGFTRVALIASIDATGQDGENELGVAFRAPESAGMTLVDSERFNSSDQSVAAQIQRIANAKPDGLIVWTTGPQFGTVLRAYNDAGLLMPVASANGNLSVVLMDQLRPYLPKDLTFPGPYFLAGVPHQSAPTYKPILAYINAVRGAGLNNDVPTGVIWDPAMILVDAYRKLGTDATAAQVRDYIEGLRHWVGTQGIYDFSRPEAIQRGLTTADAVMVKWDRIDRHWVIVSKAGGEKL